MTVSTTGVEVRYHGNGATYDFPVSFQFFDDADLLVYVDDELQASGYTVTGGAGATGTVTFVVAPPLGSYNVRIRRRTARTQAVDIANNTSVLEQVLEEPADRNVMLVQEALDKADRAVVVPDGEEGFELEDAESRAGKIAAFDEDGNLYGERSLDDFDADVASAADSAAAAAGSEAAALGYAGAAQAAQTGAETAQTAASASAAAAAASAAAAQSAVSVLAFGATGGGVVNDLAAFQAALDSGSKRVLVPEGTYLIAGTLVKPAGVTLEGTARDGCVLVGARITVDGALGSEAGLTGAAVAGDTTVSFPTAGLSLSAGDYVRLVSCVNASTSDAGVDQLGAIDLACYFGEFVRAKTVAAGSITLVNGVTFPYATTPGASSGARTNSTARKVSFAEGGGVRGLTFNGPWSTTAPVVQATLAKDHWVDDCRFNLAAYGVRALDALDCLGGGMRKSYVVRDPFSSAVMTSTSWNSVIFRGCTETVVDDCDFDGGNQIVDFTFRITGATDPVAVPPIGCVARNNRARNAFEGFTTHENAYACKFVGNVVAGCQRGVRNRSKRTLIFGNSITGTGVAGDIGVYNYGGFTDGTLIFGNTVEGRQYGISLSAANADGTPIQPGRTVVAGNDVSHCSTGIYAETATASALLRPWVIKNNIVRECSDTGINLSSYNSGTLVEGNVIVGPFGGSANAGIRYSANITDLKIKNNVLVGLGSVPGIRGNSVTTMITDLTTFPLGDAEARLVIEGNEFIGHTSGSETSGLVRVAAAYADEKGGSTAFRRLDGKQVFRQLGAIAGAILEVQTSAGLSRFSVDETGLVTFGAGALKIATGSGTPEAAVTAPVGSLYLRSNGAAGSSLYVKETGTGNTGWVAYGLGAVDIAGQTALAANAVDAAADYLLVYDASAGANRKVLYDPRPLEAFTVALGDETTAITAGTAKTTWRAPYACTVVAVRASLSTASSSGDPTFDINEGGTSILGTKLSIDSGEKTSVTATSAATITDASLADDAELTFDIDTAGTGAKGAKVTLYLRRAT